MQAVVDVGWLWQGKKWLLRWVVVGACRLAGCAGFDVESDVSVHVWPEVVVDNPMICFKHTHMSSREAVVSSL